VPITLSDGLSGERHKLTDTQIRASCKKQPGFATQSLRKRPFAALPRHVAKGHLRPSAPQQSLTYSVSSDDRTPLAGIGFDLLLGIARLG
jgi:hypothetical protein